MAIYTCRHCRFESDKPWEDVCPNCKGFYRPRKFGVDSMDQKTSELRTMGSKPSLSKIHHISTGNEGFDHVLSGGLVAGRVLLIGGFAGVGKTRTLLSIADYIAKTQGKVIYASGEESADQVDSYAASLGMRNDQVIILGNQYWVEPVLDLAKKIKAFLVIWDSGQKFASKDSSGSPGSISQCKAIGTEIKHYCGTTKTCAIIVNQMGKDGDLKGGTELEHHCDTISLLAFAKDDDLDKPLGIPDVRLYVVTKNRTGQENLKSYFKMNEEGRLELLPPREKEAPSQGRRKYRRDDDEEDLI